MSEKEKRGEEELSVNKSRESVLDLEIIRKGNSPQIREQLVEVQQKVIRCSRNQYIGMTEQQLEEEKKVITRMLENKDITENEYKYQVDLIKMAMKNKKPL